MTSTKCSICHQHQGNGTFTALGGSNFKISESLTRRGGFAGLVKYIADEMPRGNPAGCVGACALNSAGYMVSLASDGPQDPVGSACDAEDPLSYGIRTLKLLTKRELKNSLLDLRLAVESDFANDPLPPDSPLTKSSYPIHLHAKIAVDETRNNTLRAFAEKIAPGAASRMRQDYSSACGNSGTATNCANTFVDTIAKRIFRRPLTNDERTTYTKFFNDGLEEGLTQALTAAMLAPQFLYRSELGIPVAQAMQQNLNIGTINGRSKLQLVEADAYVLTHHEFAAALAYMYTGSTPDATLLQAADRGELATDAQINTQIDRLLATSRGREHIGEFGANWMRADDVLKESRPNFSALTDQIKRDMADEVRELFRHVFFGNSIPFEQFYSGDYSMVNGRLAQYYGGSNHGTDWRSVTLPNRGGVITTGAFMTANADAVGAGSIKRAVDVRELMLCHHLGAPPQDLGSAEERERLKQEAIALEARGDMTDRIYFEAITKATACASCHEKIINPLFGMDDFDQYGRFRTQVTGRGVNGIPGLPTDTRGILWGPNGLDNLDEFLEFNGSKDLGKKIAQLPDVHECLVVNSFRYATGLPIDEANYSKQGGGQIDEPVRLNQDQKEDYACVKEQLLDVYDSSSHSAKSVYRKIGTLDLIRLRKPIARSQVNQ